MKQRIKWPYAWVGHIPFAYYLVEQIKPKTIVELGTHSGNSFTAFCRAAKLYNPETKVNAIDLWTGDEHAGFYDPDIYIELKNYIDLEFKGIGKLIKNDFNEAVFDFADQSIDILHIDGLHTYSAVKNDFETWLPKMAEDGIILFHDTTEFRDDFGVFQFWNEITEQYPHFYNFPHSHGLGVLSVSKSKGSIGAKFIQTLNADKFLQDQLIEYGNALIERESLKGENLILKNNIDELLQSKIFILKNKLKRIMKIFKF